MKKITSQAHEQLGSVLGKIKTSHEPVFVFEKEKFIGLFSPYNAFFVHRYPYTAHLSHCLLKPPVLTAETSLYDIAHFMLETKLYVLPILDKNKIVVKTVKVKEILNYIVKNEKVLEAVSAKIVIKKPEMLPVHSTLKEVYKLMRTKKIGRVILVNKHKAMEGIISRSDLQSAFLTKTTRQRYVTRKHPPVSSSFDEEEISRLDEVAMEFATQRIFLMKQTTPIREVIEKMIQAKKNTVVLTENNEPVGFVSRHDILEAFVGLKSKEEIPVIWSKHFETLSQTTLEDISQILDRFLDRYHKIFPLRRAELHLEKNKNAAGKEKKYITIKLHLLLKSGGRLIAEEEGWNISGVLRGVIKKIEHASEKLYDRE